MEPNLQSYLVDIAREEAASKEAEVQSLRNSLRYRIGGWVLEAFPPGRRTLVVLWRLATLYFARLRGRLVAGKHVEHLTLPEKALRSTTLVLGSAIPEEFGSNHGLWQTENSRLMALRLDSIEAATTLILCEPSKEVLRRLARARLDGTKVIWWPKTSADLDPALVSYIRANANECRDDVSP